MAKNQKSYTLEFKQQMVDLYHTGGYSYPQLESEYGVVLKSKHETFYCDRIADKNKSCKVIGNKLEYQKKVAADVLQCYERKYKANHAQTGRESDKEITTDEMGKAKTQQKQWSKQAQKMRKTYLEGDISANEFSTWLDSY